MFKGDDAACAKRVIPTTSRTTMKIIIENVLWIILGFGIPGTFASVLCFSPTTIIRFQGKFYRYFYGLPKESTGVLPPNNAKTLSSLFFIDNHSEFARNAFDNPEQFTRLIIAYRIFGIIMFAMLGLGIAMLGLFVISQVR